MEWVTNIQDPLIVKVTTMVEGWVRTSCLLHTTSNNKPAFCAKNDDFEQGCDITRGY